MIHELLHIIGLCPDSFGHLDLIDIYVGCQDVFFRPLIVITNYLKK